MNLKHLIVNTMDIECVCSYEIVLEVSLKSLI